MTEKVRLTRRQETFLEAILDMYRTKRQEPIHYTEVAARIGVNRFTAYDMLKLLEEKGMVKSSYQIRESGPGRSSVVFLPTEAAQKQFAATISQIDYSDWNSIRDLMISRVKEGVANEQELLEGLVARVGVTDSLPPAVQFSVELLTIILLRLQNRDGSHHLPHIISPDSPTNAQQLILLAGFALGILAASDEIDEHWEYELIEHIKQYQTVVAEMSAAELNQLIVEFDKMLTTVRGNRPTDAAHNQKE